MVLRRRTGSGSFSGHPVDQGLPVCNSPAACKPCVLENLYSRLLDTFGYLCQVFFKACSKAQKMKTAVCFAQSPLNRSRGFCRTPSGVFAATRKGCTFPMCNFCHVHEPHRTARRPRKESRERCKEVLESVSWLKGCVFLFFSHFKGQIPG